MTQKTFTVVGGGPVGTLLAISLARHGYEVEIGFEANSGLARRGSALSDRGWSSLEKLCISAQAKNKAIPMHHRAVHAVDGSLS